MSTERRGPKRLAGSLSATRVDEDRARHEVGVELAALLGPGGCAQVVADRLPAVLGQPPLGRHGGPGAGADGGRELAVDLVCHVARCEDAWHVGVDLVAHVDVTALAQRHRALEVPGVGLVADVDEHAVGLEVALLARLDVLQPPPVTSPSCPRTSVTTVFHSKTTLG